MDRFFKEIYNFFPKGIAFSDERYKGSSEYLQQLKRRKRCKESLGYFQNKIKEVSPRYAVINSTNLDFRYDRSNSFKYIF
ncbi:hypothetical protein [Paenibacillus sp. KS-LC4]|uniref:hypothetical protein n=1 Tax=Paenibacillus sp. KS-LC4 TaxID=2979727 RepID=UPI0030D2F9AE